MEEAFSRLEGTVWYIFPTTASGCQGSLMAPEHLESCIAFFRFEESFAPAHFGGAGRVIRITIAYECMFTMIVDTLVSYL